MYIYLYILYTCTRYSVYVYWYSGGKLYMLQPHMIQTSRKNFKKHLTHLFLRDNIQSQQTNRHNKNGGKQNEYF